MRLRGPVRSRRGPARPHSWMDPGQEPRRASPQPPPVAQGEPTARSRPPQSHIPPTPLTLLKPEAREGPGCARGGVRVGCRGVGRGPGAPAAAPAAAISLAAAAPPAPTASFHKSPGAQPVPAFQAGPAPAAAVPKHEASSPNPRLRRIARRGVESRERRRARGAVAANFPPGPAGRPTLDPRADPLPSGPPPRPGALRGKEAASPARNGSYWSGIRKQAAAAFPLATNGLR